MEEVYTSKLPSLYIDIQPEELNSVLSNCDYKAPARALLLSAVNDTLFEGELDHIKTRGNTTFSENKKPFTIKFLQKQKLLGLNKNRSFVLLANAKDESHIRNTIAFDLAQIIGLPAPKYAYVSLYINGEYKGLYQMTNKVEVGKHTLNITDLDKLNKQANTRPLSEYNTWSDYGINEQTVLHKGVLLEHDPIDITGGYLLDNSGMNWIYCKSISGFVSNAGDPIRIRTPKYASPNEVNYIETFYNQMEAAVFSVDGYNPQTGKHYSEYIDMESFARYYLLNELLLNQDGGFASFFMYKDSDSIDSKLYAGPVWDFDKSLYCPRCNAEVIVFNEIYAGAEIGDFDEPHSKGLLFHLLRHEDFRRSVKDIYYQIVSPSCHEYLNRGSIDSLVNVLCDEANKDNQLYHTRINADYYTAVNMAIEFLKRRLEFFDWYFSSSLNDIISADYKSKSKYPHERKIRIIYRVGEPIPAPSHLKPVVYKYDLVHELYVAGTDSIIPDGTVLYTARNLELRWREPTWREVQMRRIRKKLMKWGLAGVFEDANLP